jgi:hypothetical protein
MAFLGKPEVSKLRCEAWIKTLSIKRPSVIHGIRRASVEKSLCLYCEKDWSKAEALLREGWRVEIRRDVRSVKCKACGIPHQTDLGTVTIIIYK